MQIRAKIFIIILVTVLVLGLVFSSVVFVWQLSLYKDRTLSTYEKTAEGTIRQIDTALAQLGSVSLSIAYSNYIKSQFKTTAISTEDASDLINAGQLGEVVFSIIGPQLTIPQVYIFAMSGGSFGHGLDSGIKPYSSYNMDWYRQAVERKGSKYITLPAVDQRIAAASPFEGEREYTSLVRMFYNSQNVPQGFVEVIQRSDRIFAGIYTADREVTQFVISREGDIVYGTPPAGISGRISIPPDLGGWQELADTDQLIYLTQSEESEFVLATVVPKSVLTTGYKELISALALASVLVVIIMIPVVFYTSNSLSRPIRKLYQSIRHTDLESISDEKFESIGTNIIELVELDKMLRRMKYKIGQSVEEVLLSREQEMQSRMLALQAQMDPHFLYNSLATISAMASDGMTDDIELFCEDISGLMRYVSTDKEPLVTVEKELRFTDMYIRCMQIRYPNLRLEKQVDSVIYSRLIPKLSIQILVENAIKSVTSQEGERRVVICGRPDSDGFSISITDNGSGFPPEIKERLQREINTIKNTRVLPSLQLEGMGILNVYIRLLLVFNKKAVFTMENLSPHGARVTIGVKGEQSGG